MHTNMVARIAGMLAFAVAPALAFAQPAAQPVELVGEVRLERTVIENGTERQELVEPKIVVPGDRLLFTTRYRNGGTLPARDFVVTNPVPAAVQVAPADAAQLQVSVDGGKVWGALATLTVTDAAGTSRAAQASDVTHIRWTLAEIAPGGAGALSYHAIVR